MWRHLSVCDLVSAVKPFVRVLSNSMYEFGTESCEASLGFMKTGCDIFCLSL